MKNINTLKKLFLIITIVISFQSCAQFRHAELTKTSIGVDKQSESDSLSLRSLAIEKQIPVTSGPHLFDLKALQFETNRWEDQLTVVKYLPEGKDLDRNLEISGRIEARMSY